MRPILYESITAGQVPEHNGLGVLSDCLSCFVEQKRNDIYELTMEYPIDGLHAQELAQRRVLKVKPNFTDDPQLFRIERISAALNGKFTVYARHISYDLSGVVLASGTAGSAVAACQLFQAAAPGYTFYTDKAVSASFKVTEPASVRSYFAGRTGSFLDVFGTAEIVYDNFNVKFLLHAGQNRNVQIRYKKNLLELSQECSSSNLYTHVLCYWKDNQSGTVVTSVQVSTGLQLDVDRVLTVDVSSEYQEQPTVAVLNARAQRYINDNNVTTPNNNITLDFVQSGELADRVDLCDTVTVYYEALGIERAQVKCIRTKWDCLLEKYTEIEFGEARSNVVDSLAVGARALAEKPSTTAMEHAIQRATDLISGNSGGYVINGHDSNGDGYPDENLIMDTPDINTAIKVIRENLGGIGLSTTGYAGPFKTAITAEGIVADAITTGTLNADLIKAGVISDAQGNSTIDMTNGQASLNNLKAKNAFTLVDNNDVMRAALNYSTLGGATLYLYKKSDPTKYAAVLQESSGTGGALYLYDLNADSQSVFLGVTPGVGGSLSLGDTSGNRLANLYATSAGGRLSLFQADGKTIADISKRDYGGSLALYDNNGQVLIRLIPTNYGSYAYFYNNFGTSVAEIGVGSVGEGIVYVKDSGGADTAWMAGNTGNITCVSLTQTSSKKVKKNIKKMKDAPAILKLEAVSFDYKKEALGTDRRGFIAEDVAEVLPNLVNSGDDNVPASIDYIGMIPYLQSVLKDHEERLLKLEKKNKKEE